MTVLVTGGLGFIGGHLVDLLLERGTSVRILDLAKPDVPKPGVEYWQGSIVDAELVRSAVCGVDTVFHLAANAGLWSPCKQDFLTINQMGTRNIMDAAIAYGVGRVVHTSTEAILKSNRQGQRPSRGEGTATTDESIRLRFEDMLGPYCQGKFLAEQEAFAAAEKGLPVVVVNPTVPLGPGDRRITPPTRMVLGFLNGKYPAFLETTINAIDARDVALGHILAAEKGTPGERYLLGSENLRMSELLAVLHDLTALSMPQRRVPYWLALAVSYVQEFIADTLTKRPPAAPLTGVRLAGTHLHFDNRKARVELGMICRPVRLALADAIADYLQRGLLERQPIQQ
ncbi:nucleoside-diphosphate-sugar epimerase [Rubidibacter lacunae KORDI 51-2]|uniref:Nucleoside-diphosphate-sugar epimerase n=1 Tax=Rubidibacter lacunae KORDI 51-2 TaxID=582515 RepID=U5DLS3_9CHRO|nr:NAD-dependent epimerase/dehydratase family protein [Rubidibacter lacunae]ERN40655.1 nucleoside-diphosphate-sugar epimerase [Rubidibacter lacunae KORDI 51-2]